MNSSVSALHGAMGPLICKLKVLLLEASDGNPKRWPRLLKGVKDGIDLLKEDLEEISTSLVDLSELEDPPLTAKCWMKEVRELSYDIEDYIDSFATPSFKTAIKAKTRSVRKISHFQLHRFPKRKKHIWQKEVRIKISEFRIRVQEANERHKRFKLDHLDLRRRYAPSGPMLPWRYDEAADLVIDGQMSEFMDILACDGDRQLKVVTIVGPAGLGKTTFARVLYNKIRGQFDCRAFVSMTRKSNIKHVLGDILAQVRQLQSHNDCEDLDITGRVRNYLHGKRYLIIIDNVLGSSTWNIISRAFPEGNQCSRIIITTQVANVALTCCCSQLEFLFEMKPLDIHHSRQLFLSRIFGSKSDCPEMFKAISYKIVDICGGSPLAIGNMAGYLSSHPLTLIEQWTYISDSLCTMLRKSSTSEGLRQVLNLSYNNLSHCLKSCLLYLNMYPESCKICKDDLIKQWVAEGFIESIEGRDMERTAISYFDELVHRRFIQPACVRYNNEIISCTVHDTIYDLIAHNSSEENFVMVVDSDRKNVELSNKVHRLSINFGDAMYAKAPKNIRMSHVRSLAFSGFFASMPSFAEFKLLRVLNLQLSGCRGDDILNLTGISELFQLRYLKVVSDVCIRLPRHMRGLHYLETLDVDAEINAFPWDISCLPCLLHLRLPFETNLMGWNISMGSETVRKLDKLTSLRDLRLIFSIAPPNHIEKSLAVLGSLLEGLENLEILALVPDTHGKTMDNCPLEAIVSWDGFAVPLHLKRFEWSLYSCIFSRVPKWIEALRNLCVLKFVVKELHKDGVDILKRLPTLTALSLYVRAPLIERIVFDKAEFSDLKFFKFRCSVPLLKFKADAMPNLLKLKLSFNASRMAEHHNIPLIVIEHLPCLKQIDAKIGGAGAAGESTLMAAVSNHPKNPTINIQLVDWMFFNYEDRARATEDKEQLDNFMLKETLETVSREDAKKQADLRISTPSAFPSHPPLSETLEAVSQEDAKKQADLRISTPSAFPSHPPLSDIQQLLIEAQHRWLRPAEICEILRNYRNFRIAPEPPCKPPSGSLFLFDRRVLRNFRKDGHNWKKKRDQKTVKEVYEKLKLGGVDVLHCYYALREDNINFHRRTYWMLEENFMHIVLVHYLQPKLPYAAGDTPAMENNFSQSYGSLEGSSLSVVLNDTDRFVKSGSDFTTCMSKELPQTGYSQIQSSSGVSWSNEEGYSSIKP